MATTCASVGDTPAAGLLLVQVTLQTWFFLSYLQDALAVAANGLVADSLGRDDVARAVSVTNRCVGYGGVISLALFVLLFAAPGAVAALFSDSRCVPSACSAGCCVPAWRNLSSSTGVVNLLVQATC